MARLRPRTAVLALLTAALAWPAAAAAQESLDDLQQAFQRERRALGERRGGDVRFEDVQKLAADHTRRLAAFLAKATGSDLHNGRLMLADIHLQIGQRDEAKAVLAKFDAKATPPLELVAAAEMARFLNMEQSAAWIDAAIAADAPLEDRMALAMFLITRLLEIERGQKIFDDAYAAAEGDDAKAHVLWFRAAATREREDVPEGAYDEALDELAERYGDTYWGGVARDRLKALAFRVGDPAIPFTAKDLAGDAVSVPKDYRGKVLLLDFSTTWQDGAAEDAAALQALQAKFGKRGFVVLGISLDDDRRAVEQAAKKLGVDWRVAWDGKGMLTDAALRYCVEAVPQRILIGRDGKIAGLRLRLDDDYGREEFEKAVDRALGDR